MKIDVGNPSQPSTKLQIVIPTPLLQAAKERAEEIDRSVAGYIRWLIREDLERRGED